LLLSAFSALAVVLGAEAAIVLVAFVAGLLIGDRRAAKRHSIRK
jgi:hypothetical protein